MLNTAGRMAYGQEHELFRDTVRKVFAKVMAPNLDRHDAEGIVGRAEWRAVGEAGLLCPTVSEAYGGLGLDFGYNAVVAEELAYIGSSAGFTLQSDITANYIERYGSEEQKRKYLPGMVSGEIISAIAMTEPGTGSDLQGIRTTARRDGNELVVNGSKTYITNGQNADIVILVAKTDPELGAKGTSLVLVEAGAEGFERGRNLDKIGQHSADTSELFFNDVRVPVTNLLGEEGARLRLSDGRTAAGAPVHRHFRAGGRAACLRRGGRLHERAKGVRNHRVPDVEYQVHIGGPRRAAAGRLGSSRLGLETAHGR